MLLASGTTVLLAKWPLFLFLTPKPPNTAESLAGEHSGPRDSTPSMQVLQSPRLHLAVHLGGLARYRPCSPGPSQLPSLRSFSSRARRHALTRSIASPEVENSALPHVVGQQSVSPGSPVHGVDKLPFRSLPQMWGYLSQQFGDQIAAEDPHHIPATKHTYRELDTQIRQFAAGLKELGLQQGDKVSLFSENGTRWLLADQAVMLNGAADAVRGASGPASELVYILRHSGSTTLITQDTEALDKLLPELSARNLNSSPPTNGAAAGSNGSGPEEQTLKAAIVLWGQPSKAAVSAMRCPVLSFEDVMAKGAGRDFQAVPVQGNDLATLCYTSGTSGSAKGVMLSHNNLMYQIANFTAFISPNPQDSALSLLPPWHIYERAVGYYLYARACRQVYSSVRHFRDDLQKHPPTYFVCVPLVLDSLRTRVRAMLKKGSAAKRKAANFFFAASVAWVRASRVRAGTALQYAREPRPLPALLRALAVSVLLYPLHRLGQVLVYSKIRAALGISRAVVSGGGSLPPALDDWYEAIGLPVLNGWGLTETSPVLSCRAVEHNVRGSVGMPTPGTSLKVVDPASLDPLPDGQLGLLLARGPGVMQGYYANDAATAGAFRAGEGWFDTGDLGWIAPRGVNGSHMAGTTVLTGRAKDTIVLSGGENIEPAEIEDAVTSSSLIKFCILVGQDCRSLGALIVPDPEALKEIEESEGQLSEERRRQMIQEVVNEVSAGKSPSERIVGFAEIPMLSPDDGTLTRSFKPRREAILAKYDQQVAKLKRRLR